METFKKLMGDIPEFDKGQFLADWRWQLLSDLFERNYKQKGQNKIPKKIHQIWLGGSFPEKYQVWADSWKKLNPDYEYKLWTDEDVPSLNLPNQKEYDSIINYGPKSDILRYYILEQFGGIYIDTDFECLKSFDELSNLEFYTGVGYPSEVELYPGLIACVAHHPIIKKVNQAIKTVTQEDVKRKGALTATSSYFFTQVFFEVVKTFQKGVVAFPPQYFYPFQNKKGHHLEDGTKYIKPESFAIHYWEVSWNKINIKTDWVQGDKFVKIADSVYAPQIKARDDYAKYPNTFDPSDLKPVNFVYTNIMYLGRLLKIVKNLPYQFVIIAHNGDQHIEKGIIGTFNNHQRTAAEPYELPSNVLKLYSTNVDVIDPRIDSIPLGLENTMWGEAKKETIKKFQKMKGHRPHLVYMNHAINTNREERSLVYTMFGKYPWVTTEIPKGNRHDLDNYYHKIATHKFILNPWGNCFDNHRMWEAWYLGCIPITRRCIFTSFYEDMPMVLIDSWKEVTQDFLFKEYERISKMNWNHDKLTFAYWRNKVKSIQ